MKSKTDALRRIVVAIVALTVPGVAPAQDAGTPDNHQVFEQPIPCSTYVDQHFPQQVFFGDMHHPRPIPVGRGWC